MDFTGPKPTGTPRQIKPVIERRQSPRLVVHSPAYASLNGSSAGKARDLSEILEISEGGMSIQTSAPLETGRELNLTLDLSETKARIKTAGRVIWSNASGRAGVCFPGMSGASLRELREWLFVNVITAFDHAREWTASPAKEEAAFYSNGPLGLSSMVNNVNHSARKAEALPGKEPAPEKLDGNSVRPGESTNNIVSSAEALQFIASRALALTDATGAAIALSVGDEMICQASAGSDAPPVGTRLQSSSGFSGECVRTARSLRCDDSETDELVDREGCRSLGIRSIVAVPILEGARVTGLLEAFSPQPYAFSAKDTSVLQELTKQIFPSAKVVDAPASSDGERMPFIRKPPLRLQRVQVERPEIRSSSYDEAAEALRESMNAEAAPGINFHKIILVFAVLTFILAVVWLVAPWASSRLGKSRPGQVQEASVPVSRQVNLPANVNDLASLRQVAERGDPAAQFALGARYATGEEVKQDYTEAVRWFARAADQGHILAQATLGAYYWAGRGVSPDLTKAYFWSALAQAGGDQASKYRVAVLTSRMSRTQILAAQQQANDWLRNHQTAGSASAAH